jgi:very-short-patch-repair endonuclease
MNNNEIIQKYNEGMSTYELATEYKTYPNKIRRILKKGGIVIRDKSEAQKVALETGRSTPPTKGRERTYEEKLKISKSTVKHWENLTDEEREEFRQLCKERWNELPEEKLELMRKAANEKIRQAALEGSKLEKKIQQILIAAKIKFESHKKNLVTSVQKLEIDLYLPELLTIIEVDGLSHFEPIWGEEHLEKQQKFDSQKDGLLLSKGFNIIRIENKSNSMAISKIEDLKDELLKYLEEIKVGNLQSTLKVITYG